MQRIPREQAKRFEFDPRFPTLLEVDPGEEFEVETEDAGTGRIRSPDFVPSVENRPELKATPPRVNSSS